MYIHRHTKAWEWLAANACQSCVYEDCTFVTKEIAMACIVYLGVCFRKEVTCSVAYPALSC